MSLLEKLRLERETPLSLVSLCMAVIFVVVFLTLRNAGLYPTVFADEWEYSLLSRLTPISESYIPSYLYLLLFRATNYCGDGFLQCARIINACFFALALPFIYLICRNYASWRLSLFVALVSVLGPISIYSAFFMPEAMYFFSFWLLSWFILTWMDSSPYILGAGVGSLLGLMAMIKVHAIFLFPGFWGFVLLAWITKLGKHKIKETISTLAYSILAFLLVRGFLGYLIARKPGLHLLGGSGKYGAYADSALNFDRLLSFLSLARVSLVGHLEGLAIIFGVPLAIMAGITCNNEREDKAIFNLRAIQIFAIAFLPPLLFIIALFTAQTAGSGPYESISRLGMRIYNFIFPLFFVIAAAHVSLSGDDQVSSRRAWLTTLIVGVASVYSFAIGLRNYSPVLPDCPELRGFTVNATAFFVFWFLGLISLIIWAINRKWGASIYIFLFVPLAMATSSYFVSTELRQRLVTDAYDEAGQFAHRYLGSETSRLLIAATDLASLYRTQFYVDNSTKFLVQIPEGAPLDSSKIPAGITWALLIGDHQPPSTARYQISMGDYALIKVSGDESVDFRNKRWPRVLTKIKGVSDPEGFGRWSNAEDVVMEFEHPLPKRFNVVLTGYAFGPNVDQPFRIRIGQNEQLFRLAALPQEVSLSFNSTGVEKILRVTIPKPISPKELGLSVDDRRLGIALQLLRIDDLSDKR